MYSAPASLSSRFLRGFISLAVFFIIPAFSLFTSASPAAGAEGKRPYEMEWAHRYTDEVPPLADFETPQEDAWTVETQESAASFERSNEQKIWGDFTGKLTYRCTSEKPQRNPKVILRLKSPLPLVNDTKKDADKNGSEGTGNHIAEKTPSETVKTSSETVKTPDFDAISCWIYGNNWSWVPDPTTPPVSVAAMFETSDGKHLEYTLAYVNWREWFLAFLHLTPEQCEVLHQPGTCFTGFSISGGRNTEDRVLYFDNFAVRKDSLTDSASKLVFSQRPKRGIVVPEQNQGVNTGEGVLPFPTRPETVLPDCRFEYKNSVTQDFIATSDGSDSSETSAASGVSPRFTFMYTAQDGTLKCVYAPGASDTAPWNSLTVCWNDGSAFHPLENGGVKSLAVPSAPSDLSDPVSRKETEICTVIRHEFVSAEKKGDTVETVWNVSAADASGKEFRVPVKYTLQMKGKSLILETRCVGGMAAAVTYGFLRETDVQDARLVAIPYYTYGYSGHNRPETVVFRDSAGTTLFLMGSTDWYLGNGSELSASARVENGCVFYNDGVRYNAKTDGTRNDCYERFFVTVSPDFQEVLPTIPNPKSPWIHVMGTHQWHACGAGDRQKDCDYWFDVKRHGITEGMILDHEVEWRDSGESFTFRTRTAPGKGGDEGQKMFSDFMNRKLGFYYGPYNNFTDFAPVNEYWNTDMVSRSSDKQMMKAWPRCYAPKPVRAVEFCEKLTPINQEKFNFRCAYCDVHTAVSPWSRVDYDSRVPGAGTYAGTFYAFGEIMLLQKAGWKGPVYSEGPMHHLYLGVNDGSYAQDQGYDIPENPWLVDYDLLKMHSLGCGFGMGNPGMFFGRNAFKDLTPEEKDARLDRFFAATLAFGHPGFLTLSDGFRVTWRGYYGSLALHSRYTQVPPEYIRYCGEDGKLYTTSEALSNGAYKLSQVVVKYTDGTVICANGGTSLPMETTVEGRRISLVPTAYTGWSPLGNTASGENASFQEIYTYSALQNGSRCDYAVSPDYIYLDGRETFQRFPFACGSGAGVCRKIDENHWEIITLSGAQMGFKIPGKCVKVTAEALAHDGSVMGNTRVFSSRGYFYAEPVKDAFSYRVETVNTSDASAETVKDVLFCARARVLAGETVSVSSTASSEVRSYTVPENAVPGACLWYEADGGKLDFLVSPLCFTEITSETPTSVTLRLAPALDLAQNTAPDGENTVSKAFQVHFQGLEFPVKNGKVTIPFEAPTAESTGFYELEITDGTHSQTVGIRSRLTQDFVPFPFEIQTAEAWMQIRNQPIVKDFGKSGAGVNYGKNSCDGVARTGFFTHPPYIGGVGRSGFDLTLTLPQDPLQVRAFVGKKDGSDVGDGIYYKIAVLSEEGSEQVLAEESVENHTWKPLAADLTPWCGKRIVLRFITDCGPKNNTAGDWGLWGDIEFVSAQKKRTRTSEFIGADIMKTVSAPETRPVTPAELQSASRAWLCYAGKGLAGTSPEIPTTGKLNGIPFGNLYSAAGDEKNGIFSKEVRVPLPPEVISSLKIQNIVEIISRDGDCFSIRDFRILVELPDGTLVSSWLAPAVYSQPGEWAYAEGIRLPENAEFLVPVRFQE